MRQIQIDRSELIRAIAQITHAGIESGRLPWVVAFDAREENTAASLLLPGQINSAGGFSEEMDEQNTVSPLEFSTLDSSFRWGENTPVVGPESDWADPALQPVQSQIQDSLKDELVLDGKSYRIQYA